MGVSYVFPTEERKARLTSWYAMNVPDILISEALLEGASDLLKDTYTSRDSSCLPTLEEISHIMQLFGYTPFSPNRQMILLNHAETCKLTSWRYPTPSILRVRDVVERPPVVSFMHQAITPSSPLWSFRQFDQVELGVEGSVVLAILETDEAGNLRLRDGASSMLVQCYGVVQSLPRLIFIKKYSVVVEKFRMLPGSTEHPTVHKIYMQFSLSDARMVSLTKSKSQFVMAAPPRLLLVKGPVITRMKISQERKAYVHAIVEGTSWRTTEDWASGETGIVKSPQQTFIEVAGDALQMLPLLGPNTFFLLPEGQGDAQPRETKDVHRTIATKEMIQSVTLVVKANTDSRPSREGHGIVSLSQQDMHWLQSFMEESPFEGVSRLLTSQRSDTADRLVSIEGILESREFKDNERPSIDENVATMAFDKYSIGLGKPIRIMVWRVRDLRNRDVVDVYMDCRTSTYPLGFLPGRHIRLRRLILHTSMRGNLCLRSTSETVATTIPEDVILGPPTDEQLPVRYYKLVELITSSLSGYIPPIVDVKCTITFIQEIKVWLSCGQCRATCLDGHCPNNCPSMHEALQASGRCYVEDGTTEARAYFDDPDSIGGVLQLAEEHLARLVRQYGELSFTQDPPWFTPYSSVGDGVQASPSDYQMPPPQEATPPEESEFERLCTRPELLRTVVMRCKRIVRHPDENDATDIPEGFVRRTFKTGEGETIPTLVHQTIILKAVDLCELDVRSEMVRLLASLE
ncbi:hypothetical protein HDU85_004886 [Gaertneriomyces sp. JEL0708]|nr:hypothetical protein HDU85_004886 [Gaertneriomyces sp. JEL0708]